MYDDYIRRVTSVVRVLDGDTVELCVDLGHHTYHVSKYRLDGFDAPETWRPLTETEREAGEKVTRFLIELLNKYKDVLYIRTSKDPKIYGRYSAALFAEELDSLGLVNINIAVKQFMTEHGLTKEQLKLEEEGEEYQRKM